LFAADLGGDVIKQCVARPGEGKSGFRILIVFRASTRAFFAHGFSKNERDNISKDELIAFKKLATALLAYGDDAITRAIESGTLVEVTCDEQTMQ